MYWNALPPSGICARPPPKNRKADDPPSAEPIAVLDVNPSPDESMLKYTEAGELTAGWQFTSLPESAKVDTAPQAAFNLTEAAILRQTIWWWLLLAGAAALVGFALSRSLALSIVLSAAIGATVMMFLTTCNSTIQSYLPDALRGRVMSIYTLALIGSGPLNSLIAGVLGSGRRSERHFTKFLHTTARNNRSASALMRRPKAMVSRR